MLKQRIVTAIVLLAIIGVVLFFSPPIAFTAMLMLVYFIAAWEWSNLSSIKHPVLKISYAVTVVLTIMTMTYVAHLASGELIVLYVRDILGAGCTWWAIALVWVIYYPLSAVYWRHPTVKMLMGFFVLVPSAIALIYLRSLPLGQWVFLYVVGIVVVADVGAYFVGRALGKSKLAPNVSPGKSWAGFWGGFFISLIYASVVGFYHNIAGLSAISLVMVTGFAALASVLGDLLESMLKRERGIKDSSQLLPGHGGFMDRIDSITAAAPVFALLTLLLGIAR